MARYVISDDAALAEFAQRHIPENCTVRLPVGRADPTVNPKDRECDALNPVLRFLPPGLG